MKRILTLAAVIFISATANAQETAFDPFRNRDFLVDLLHITSVIIAVYLITSFILSIIKMFLDNRLKNKMLEKGASENLVVQFLQPEKKDSRNAAIKWAILAAGVGFGLSLVLFFLPFGIHSVTIMAFSVSLSFLCYYYFMKKTGN